MSKVWRGSFYKEKTKCTPYISVAPELGVNPTFLRVVEMRLEHIHTFMGSLDNTCRLSGLFLRIPVLSLPHYYF